MAVFLWDKVQTLVTTPPVSSFTATKGFVEPHPFRRDLMAGLSRVSMLTEGYPDPLGFYVGPKPYHNVAVLSYFSLFCLQPQDFVRRVHFVVQLHFF
jgi:hypothetical protein